MSILDLLIDDLLELFLISAINKSFFDQITRKALERLFKIAVEVRVAGGYIVVHTIIISEFVLIFSKGLECFSGNLNRFIVTKREIVLFTFDYLIM